MGALKKEKKVTEPQYFTSVVNNQVLNYRVYVMKPLEKLIYSILTIVAGGLVGLIFYGGLFKNDGEATFATFISNIVVFILIGLLAKKLFLPTIAESLRKKRISKLRVQFRDFLDAMTNSLSSGANINDAVENAYSDLLSQYIVVEVKEMISGIHNGVPIEDMLRSFGERSGTDDITNFSVVFETAYRTGGNIKDIIRRTTDIISEKMMISEEIETKLTSNKMQMRAMNVIPIFLVLMLRLSSSEFAAAFASIIGVVCMTIGVGFFVAAYFVGQKMMDIKG